MTNKKPILQFKNSEVIKEKLQNILPPELLANNANNNKERKVIEKKAPSKVKTPNQEIAESKNPKSPKETKEPLLVKKKKNKNKLPDARYKEIYGELSDKFPNLFSLDKNLPKKILKIGISEDLKNHPDIAWCHAYKKFLGRYTRSSSYIKAHTKAAKRYDLDGNVSGEVTAEEYANKLEFLAKKNNINQEKTLKNQ